MFLHVVSRSQISANSCKEESRAPNSPPSSFPLHGCKVLKEAKKRCFNMWFPSFWFWVIPGKEESRPPSSAFSSPLPKGKALKETMRPQRRQLSAHTPSPFQSMHVDACD
ncbi:hypothetical protein KP509_39G030500 [Ceratopteris richardii]|uniref:Uncharacterized protein n=1 Tax=Ceratopteris richardii TaxID=49495 RepID=A0A8T2PZW3_CERRI|nr:hypothetical protein KP509_39G030500 [Ceratopteris richardii]